MATEAMKQTHYVTVNNEEIGYNDIGYDVNGNRRYVVHFLALDVRPGDYGKIPGLTKYRAKWYGGGYVFQSVNLSFDLNWMQQQVKDYYRRLGIKALAEAQKMTDDELLKELQ